MGFPFKHDLENFQEAFISHGRNPKDYFCFGEIIVKKEERKKGISKKLFEALFSYGKSLNKYKYYCFYTLERDSDHHKPPKDYPPVKLIWKKQGFQEHPELVGSISYKEIGERKESLKKMIFWIKKI